MEPAPLSAGVAGADAEAVSTDDDSEDADDSAFSSAFCFFGVGAGGNCTSSELSMKANRKAHLRGSKRKKGFPAHSGGE